MKWRKGKNGKGMESKGTEISAEKVNILDNKALDE